MVLQPWHQARYGVRKQKWRGCVVDADRARTLLRAALVGVSFSGMAVKPLTPETLSVECPVEGRTGEGFAEVMEQLMYYVPGISS